MEDENESFLVKWEHRLDIGDVDLFVKEDLLRDSCFKDELNSSHNMQDNKLFQTFKDEFQHKLLGSLAPKSYELILSFKSIYKNTYDIFVMDIDSRTFVFKHQTFHLWERGIKGCFLFHSNQFLTITETGVFAQSLAQRNKRMVFKDTE